MDELPIEILGIWDDSHIEGLKRIVDECKRNGSKIGVQLGHSGRKCEIVSEEIIAPSAVAFNDSYRTPVEMSKDNIIRVIHSFRQATLRVQEAGFDLIELHGAHGYLINEFLSPLTNKRTDEYGGSMENRARFLIEVVKAVREVWDEDKPLVVRISAEEYYEKGNHCNDLIEIINLVKDYGIDVVDVSSGGVIPVSINTYPGYQLKFAESLREATELSVIAGGLITNSFMAEEIIQNHRADMVFLGRELLRNPYWPLQAASDLEHDLEWPKQYIRRRLFEEVASLNKRSGFF